MTDGWNLQHGSRNSLSRVSFVGAQLVWEISGQVLYNIFQQCSTIKSPLAVPHTKILDFQWPIAHTWNIDSRLCVSMCVHVFKPGFFLVTFSSPVLSQAST